MVQSFVNAFPSWSSRWPTVVGGFFPAQGQQGSARTTDEHAQDLDQYLVPLGYYRVQYSIQ
jgi:hypothetical protein